MRLSARLYTLALASICFITATPRSATAIPACVAADIVQADPGCPAGTGTCTITRTFEVGNGCILDFGARDVVIEATGELDVASNSVTLRSKSLVLRPRGTINSSGDLGASVCIETTGNVVLERGVGRGIIDVSGVDFGGCLDIDALGSVIIDGELHADQTGLGGTGGEIIMEVGGNLTTGPQSVLSAGAVGEDSTGGVIDIEVEGNAQMTGPIDVTGAAGGEVAIISFGSLTTAGINARATRGANEGGTVSLESENAMMITGNVNADASGPDELTAACGGSIDVAALFGDVTVAARIEADGSAPDGTGGCIEIGAAGDLSIQGAGLVSSTTFGLEGCGGSIGLLAGLSLSHAGTADISGGANGGFFDASASRQVSIAGGIDAQGRDAGAFGGSITIDSGLDSGPGQIVVTATGLLDAAGGRCSFDLGCGSGGDIELIGCTVNVQTGARILSVAPDGGRILATARKQLTIAGRLDATTNAPSEGGDGTIIFTFPMNAPPITTGATLTPNPELRPRSLCTQLPPTNQCLIPCPTCGNGITEFPETCDLGSPVPSNCNGCSSNCQTQVCDDKLTCTLDMCDPRLGCFAVPTTIPCFEPTNTPTITSTPTITGTPTITETPTITGTPTPTATPTNTPLVTNTPTSTATPVSGRPGDANCDRVINVQDRVAIEHAIFETTTCPGADVNVDGAVTAADLAAFVRNSPM